MVEASEVLSGEELRELVIEYHEQSGLSQLTQDSVLSKLRGRTLDLTILVAGMPEKLQAVNPSTVASMIHLKLADPTLYGKHFGENYVIR